MAYTDQKYFCTIISSSDILTYKFHNPFFFFFFFFFLVLHSQYEFNKVCEKTIYSCCNDFKKRKRKRKSVVLLIVKI